MIALGDNIMIYFIYVFPPETRTYLDVRIHKRLWPKMFRLRTDGYNGYFELYMKSFKDYVGMSSLAELYLRISEQDRVRS